MVDSNGKQTAATGVAPAKVQVQAQDGSIIHLDWPEAVFNPHCPVNLLSVSDILNDKDGAPRDNNVLLKTRQLILNESDPVKRKVVPIVFMHGLYCVLFASLVESVAIPPVNIHQE
jgi:hypothetical protein